ncbi:hypothetical protein AAC387_Pa11g1788 [Persea americana]
MKKTAQKKERRKTKSSPSFYFTESGLVLLRGVNEGEKEEEKTERFFMSMRRRQQQARKPAQKWRVRLMRASEDKTKAASHSKTAACHIKRLLKMVGSSIDLITLLS